MSKGSTIHQIRIPDALQELMIAAIELRNQNTREEPWTTSSFVRAAIREKVEHMARSRLSRGKVTNRKRKAETNGN